jgi:hypothetical protein
VMFELTVLLDHYLNVTYQVICERADTSPAAPRGSFVEQLAMARDHFNDEIELVDVPLAIFGQAAHCTQALALTVPRANVHGQAWRISHRRSGRATLENALHQATHRLVNTLNRLSRVLVDWESLLDRRLTELYVNQSQQGSALYAAPSVGHMSVSPPSTLRAASSMARLYNSMRVRLDETMLERARVFQNLVDATTALSEAWNEILMAARVGALVRASAGSATP